MERYIWSFDSNELCEWQLYVDFVRAKDDRVDQDTGKNDFLRSLNDEKQNKSELLLLWEKSITCEILMFNFVANSGNS